MVVRHAVVVRGGDEVGADQPVGASRRRSRSRRRAARTCRVRAASRRAPQRAARRRCRCAAPGRRPSPVAPYGGQADVGRVVPQEQQHQRHDGERGDRDDQRGGAPAVLGRPARRAPAGRSAARWRRAAVRTPVTSPRLRDEPAAGDGGDEDQRHRAGAERRPARPSSSTSCQLVRHEDGQPAAGGDQEQRARRPPGACRSGPSARRRTARSARTAAG